MHLSFFNILLIGFANNLFEIYAFTIGVVIDLVSTWDVFGFGVGVMSPSRMSWKYAPLLIFLQESMYSNSPPRLCLG